MGGVHLQALPTGSPDLFVGEGLSGFSLCSELCVCMLTINKSKKKNHKIAKLK